VRARIQSAAVSLPRFGLIACGVVLVLAGLVLSGVRVLQLERAELEYESPPRSLAQLAGASGSTHVSARIAVVELRAGDDTLFELCSQDRLEAERWRDAFELAVFHQPDLALMLRVHLDRATLERARRSAAGACLRLGGGRIERAGQYTLDAVWPKHPPAIDVMEVPLRARVLARPALEPRDRIYVIAIGAGILLALGAGLTRRQDRRAREAAVEPVGDGFSDAIGVPSRGVPRALTALIAIGLLVVTTELPSAGSSLTFVKGLVLVLIQIGTAWFFARTLAMQTPRAALALEPPARPLLWVGAALLSAALLYSSAELTLRLIPSTGEAPIQTFVSWPSGMLCFAALGVLLPAGEEVFFRGYLYRAALGLGRGAAFVLTLLLFIALHAEQSWGNWGGLLSIAIAGVVLTALRAASGSALIPAIAHVLYNFALSMASF
jgi:membrane protease YdiL (CAAX protease family)